MDAKQYAEMRGLRLRVVTGPTLERDPDGWEHKAYEVELFNGQPTERGFARMRTPWRQGLGIKGGPQVGEVLDCLISDARGVLDARSFEEWAGEYGYDTDSRKAEKLYEQCKALGGLLTEYLGPDWFAEAMRLDPL